MKFSKKKDIVYNKKEIPLFVSLIREKGEVTRIHCNYGEISDLLYSRINRERLNQPLKAIDKLTTNNCGLWTDYETCKKTEKQKDANIFPYEDKYLVVTISFLFDLYNDNTFANGPLGVVATKINWKAKEEIIPAIFSNDDVEKKSSRLSLNLEDFIETCNPVVYDVDLLIYGNGIQYFKGNIEYDTMLFPKFNLKGEDVYLDPNDFEDKCDNPIKAFYEISGVKLEEPYESITFHINFYEY